MRRVLLALLLLSLLPLSWSSTVQAQDIQYEVTDLIQPHKDPAFIRQGSGAVSINDSGVVAGFTGESEIKSSPFYTADGKPTRVKTGKYGATFADINNDGVIVGREVTGRTETGSPIGVPASWTNEVITRLEIPADPNGGTFVSGRALGINDRGEIVGEITYDGDDNRHVVVWAEGTATILPPAYGYPYCEGPGITESGAVGGTCWNPDAQSQQPVIWVGGVAQPLFVADGSGTLATAITDIQDGFALVGSVYTEDGATKDSVATVFENTTSYSLPSPDGLPACLADTVADTEAGLLVAGACGPNSDELNVNLETNVAVAWLNGELIDLDAATGNDGEWTFLFIAGVNSRGQMVGYGERNGELRSFLLTPAS